MQNSASLQLASARVSSFQLIKPAVHRERAAELVREAVKEPITEPQPIQQPSQDQSDELKTQAQILADLKASRAAIEGYKGQIEALKGQVNTQAQTIGFLIEQKDFYKEAASDRKQAGVLDDKNVVLLRNQIADDRVEIGQLRQENDKLRESRDRRTLFAGLGGAVVGYAACHK